MTTHDSYNFYAARSTHQVLFDLSRLEPNPENIVSIDAAVAVLKERLAIHVAAMQSAATNAIEYSKVLLALTHKLDESRSRAAHKPFSSSSYYIAKHRKMTAEIGRVQFAYDSAVEDSDYDQKIVSRIQAAVAAHTTVYLVEYSTGQTQGCSTLYAAYEAVERAVAWSNERNLGQTFRIVSYQPWNATATHREYPVTIEPSAEVAEIYEAFTFINPAEQRLLDAIFGLSPTIEPSVDPILSDSIEVALHDVSGEWLHTYSSNLKGVRWVGYEVSDTTIDMVVSLVSWQRNAYGVLVGPIKVRDNSTNITTNHWTIESMLSAIELVKVGN